VLYVSPVDKKDQAARNGDRFFRWAESVAVFFFQDLEEAPDSLSARDLLHM
jgi:hypothetical protein